MIHGHTISLNDEDRLEIEKKIETECIICKDSCIVENDPDNDDYYLVSPID